MTYQAEVSTSLSSEAPCSDHCHNIHRWDMVIISVAATLSDCGLLGRELLILPAALHANGMHELKERSRRTSCQTSVESPGGVCVRGALQSLCCPLHVSVAVGTASAHSGGGTRTGMKERGFWPPEPLDPRCPWSLCRPTLLRRGQSSQPGASRLPTETWRENELDPGDTHTSCVLHKGI